MAFQVEKNLDCIRRTCRCEARSLDPVAMAAECLLEFLPRETPQLYTGSVSSRQSKGKCTSKQAALLQSTLRSAASFCVTRKMLFSTLVLSVTAYQTAPNYLDCLIV